MKTPFDTRGATLGRIGKASLDGALCPYCRRGLLAVRVGLVEVQGRTVAGVVYNQCPACGGIVVEEFEYRRAVSST